MTIHQRLIGLVRQYTDALAIEGLHIAITRCSLAFHHLSPHVYLRWHTLVCYMEPPSAV